MSENKSEKAGAVAPATPSKVEGAQITSKEVEALKAELQAKDVELQAKITDFDNLNSEYAEFKEKLKNEFERIVGENETLKSQVDDLKKGRSKTTKLGNRYIVVDAFRGNQKADKDKIYELGDDVTDFSKERLEDLVSRGLVQKR